MPYYLPEFVTKLKKGDEVIVISGREKGKAGKIANVLTHSHRVLIDGLNTVTKHLSARKAVAAQKEPGKVQKSMSIAIANVMLKDPKTGKPTRVGYRLEADGSKVRIAKASGTVIDTIKKAAGSKSAPKAKTSTAAKAPKAKAAKAKSE